MTHLPFRNGSVRLRHLGRREVRDGKNQSAEVESRGRISQVSEWSYWLFDDPGVVLDGRGYWKRTDVALLA